MGSLDGLSGVTVNYTYGDSNWKDKLTSYGTLPITYDAIGNPLTYNGSTYTWTMGRQLSTIDKTGFDIDYKYNDAGIRVQKKVNTVTTNYHLVGDKVTYEFDGTHAIYYTYDIQENLVSMNLTEGVVSTEYYYVRNAQGDIIGLLDGNGNQVVSYTYSAWGEVLTTSGTLATTVGALNPYRYRGYRYDTETGLYYLQSRYYNPQWGRFVNADDTNNLGITGTDLSLNLFAYCENNPILYSDSSGRFINTVLGGLFGAAYGWIQGTISGNAKVGALCGLISGSLSGLGVDLAIATSGTGLLISALLGAAGAMVSKVVEYALTIKNFSINYLTRPKIMKELLVTVVFGAAFNLIGLKWTKSLGYGTPPAGLSIIKKLLYSLNFRISDVMNSAIASGALSHILGLKQTAINSILLLIGKSN